MSICQSPYWNKDLLGTISNFHLPFRSAPLSVSARRPSRPRGVAEKPTLSPLQSDRLFYHPSLHISPPSPRSLC